MIRPRRKPTLEPLEARAVPDGSNLIANGDFSLGNTGFTTQYTYSPGDIGPAQSYDVVDNPAHSRPNDVNPASYGDHTTGSGLMLAANGAMTPDVVVWSQTLAVAPGSDYDFSLWLSSWFASSPSTLNVRFNGVTVGTPTAPSTTGVWQKFSTIWNSGPATSLTISIVETTMADVGSDFALDDIVLQLKGSTVGPGDVAVTNGDGAFDVIAVDLNKPVMLAPGTYVASQFSYQFTDFAGFQTSGSIAPVLLTGGGTTFASVAVGATIPYAAPTAFDAAPFGGFATFTLTTAATVYPGLYWEATYTGGPELRMPVGYQNGVGDVFVVYGGGFGPGANPPRIGTPISGSASGPFQRTYDFSISLVSANSPPGARQQRQPGLACRGRGHGKPGRNHGR